MIKSEIHQRHLREIRDDEISKILSYIPPKSTILEIGAGAGYQSRYLSEKGLKVQAIDIKGSVHEKNRIFPVMLYDGYRIPFADRSFDVIFCSNVLEHVVEIEKILREMLRVTRAGGKAIIGLPSPSWRFWTTMTYYPFISISLVSRIFSRGENTKKIEGSDSTGAKSKNPNLISYLVPKPHGVRGNILTEMWYFRTGYWQKLFLHSGWKSGMKLENELFYTGHSLMNKNLHLNTRKRMSLFLGSACHIYILSKPDGN